MKLRDSDKLFADFLPREILWMILESVLVPSQIFLIQCSRYRKTEPGN